MRLSREYNKILYIGLIAVVSVIAVIALNFYFFEKWEKKLIQESKNICELYANQIATEVENNETIQRQLSELFNVNAISIAFSRRIEDSLTEIVKRHVVEQDGLEGGFYIKRLDDFIGYAFPTSAPPVPVYGPPPRSYNIIKKQAIATIENNKAIVDVHAFDPAIFPLASHPIKYKDEVVGSVWVRVHIERELPVTKLKRVLNFLTIISLVGFLVMAMFFFFLQNGIKNIRRELDNTRKDSGYRLKPRGGWFGFIPASINGMLDLIENEYKQRQELERELQQKEKLASLGKLIAGVAHEVKTPLSVIKMRVQMWQKEVINNTKFQEKIEPDSIKLVINEINRLSGLVKRLVVFSRPIHKNLKPARIDEIIEEVISLLDLDSSGKQISIIKKYLKDPLLVNADINSLKQVFINILTNAVEAIEESGEILIETGFDKKESVLIIEISDTGKGIPDEILNTIFDPFLTSKETGIGLGLTISHEIVAAHGGNISFRKNEENRTICLITLPHKL
ncbi:nitrogen regulation protein NR(II) [Bacteroidota bacterium]